ncbi:UNVERIFIED_CONTAM: eEF1A lysine and N-terminal methyltransferase [Sesamum radiatum]|uniref:EEF1A lysine and N-terminal methyltransferase n=1 Tax=Sesamum radiatum TaxID=300843 RepID=A0AAW2S6A3_SESRA
MFRDVSACNTYNYGDAVYWDARYVQEANCGSFDWYQRYSALRPFIRKYLSPSSRVLMVGCGNAVISEDMVKDGFEDIMNIDISSVAIEMMRKKLLKPGGLYMLITYGDPTVRMPHINQPVYNWKIELYIIPRPGFQRPAGSTESRSHLEPVPLTEKGLLPGDYVLEDPDSHFIYMCKKIDEPIDLSDKSTNPLTDGEMQR